MVLLVSLLWACNPGPQSAISLSPAPGGTLRIVSSLPLRGVDRLQSKQITEAIDLAISQQGGRAGSWNIQHISLDDGDAESGDWSASVERQNAQSAVEDPSVVAIIGPYNSGAVGLTLPIANRANLLVISPSATWPGLTRGGWNPGEPDSYYPVLPRNFARLMPPDDTQGAAAAEAARQDGVETVLVLQDGSSYSNGLAAAFISRWRALGRVAPAPVTVNPTDNVLPEQVRSPTLDAVFYAPSSASSALRIANLVAGANPALKFYATDTALGDQVAGQAGDALKTWRIVFNDGVPLTGSRFRDFSSSFQSAYGAQPGRFASNAYDAANLILDAVAKGAGGDRLKVLQTLLSTKGYEGAGGTITFDKNGDTVFWDAGIYRWQNGQFVLAYTVSGSR